MTIAPAPRSRATAPASRPGTWPASSGAPHVVRMLAGREAAVRLGGLPAGALWVECDDRSQGRVELLDPVQVALQQLDAGDLLAPDRSGQLGRGPEGQLSHAFPLPYSSPPPGTGLAALLRVITDLAECAPRLSTVTVARGPPRLAAEPAKFPRGSRWSRLRSGLGPALENLDCAGSPGAIAGHRAVLEALQDVGGVGCHIAAGPEIETRNSWTAGHAPGTVAGCEPRS